MNWMGIDPGKKGGFAVIADDNPQAYVYPYNDAAFIRVCQGLRDSPVTCCLEQVHAMPKQGVTSTFSFGMGYGYIKGVLESHGIAYQEIPPQRWKKEFGLNSQKARSIEVCARLFPAVNLRRTARCTTDHDGMAEALLMAEYARRKL